MFKKTKIAIILLVVLFVITGCGLNSEGKTCLEDLKSGLQERWDIVEKEPKSFEEAKQIKMEGIEAELNKISKYKNVDSGDSDFDKIISDYVVALEQQKKGIKEIYRNTKKYNELFFTKGYDVRLDCMKKLTSDYGFKVDSSYEERLKSLTKDKKLNAIAPNDRVEVETEYGKVAVTLFGFAEYESFLGDKEYILLCEIENISYEDEANPGLMDISYFITILDGKGYTVSPSNASYGGTDLSFTRMGKGQKRKLAVSYVQLEKYKTVKVNISGKSTLSECYLPVQQIGL